MLALALDTVALRRACIFLNLDLPLSIERERGIPGGGYYRCEAGRHKIFYDPELSPRDASRTLWHELTHAMQRESFLSNMAAFQEAAAEQAEDFERTGIVGPLEAEAISNEDYDYELRLVRKVKL